MAWVTGYEGGPPIIPGGVVDPMVGTHAALAIVAALEHRDAHRRGAARRGAAGRGRDRGDRRAGDPLLDRRHAARPARRGRRVPMRRRRRLGRGRPSTRDPLSPDDAGRSGARRAPPEDAAAELRAAGHRGRGDGAAATTTLDDPQMRARGFFEPIDTSARRRRTSTRRGRCGCRPDRERTGPAPRRRSGEHTDEVLRELGVDRRRARAARAPSTSSATAPYFG